MQQNHFAPDASAADIMPTLLRDGYVIIEHALQRSQLDTVLRELMPHIDARAPGNDEMMGSHTRRFGRLLSRSKTVQELLTHPLVLAIADQLLLPYCVRYQVNYTGVMYLDPGETAQPLHRDTGFYPIQNPAPPLLLATMWALSDFTAENGATRLVPGSRHWTDDRKPRAQEIISAEMPAGSVLLYIGSTLHGGGANLSDAPRFGLALHYSLGWLRQEENQYLAVSTEEARALPEPIQELMGYALGAAALGFVDHQDPNDFLNQRGGEQSGDIYGGVLEADKALQRFKITSTDAVGRPYFDPAGVSDPDESQSAG